MLSNLHTHTTFCDGKNTPEEMVISAIQKGFYSLGFSAHAYAPYGLEYCMRDEEGYIKEIARLKEKYKDKIEIYLGADLCAQRCPSGGAGTENRGKAHFGRQPLPRRRELLCH